MGLIQQFKPINHYSPIHAKTLLPPPSASSQTKHTLARSLPPDGDESFVALQLWSSVAMGSWSWRLLQQSLWTWPLCSNFKGSNVLAFLIIPLLMHHFCISPIAYSLPRFLLNPKLICFPSRSCVHLTIPVSLLYVHVCWQYGCFGGVSNVFLALRLITCELFSLTLCLLYAIVTNVTQCLTFFLVLLHYLVCCYILFLF